MKTFQYKAISKDGAKISGVIRSYDEFEAVATLRETCNVITRIEEVAETKGKTKSGSKKIKEKELAIICSQFSIILASGLPIVQCVEMVAAQASNESTRRMLERVAEDIGNGYSLAQSFENNSTGLPATFIETVRAGEMSGMLEQCFQRLHTFFDRSAKTKAKVISTLTYPAMVIVVAVVVFLIIMVVAVPMFTSTFRDMGVELPAITRMLIAVSDVFTKYWWVLVAVVLIFVVGRKLFLRTENGRRYLATFSLTRAPLHKLHSMNAASQFATTMSTMVAAGLPIIKALEITSAVASNYTFSVAVRQVRQEVEQGRGMAAAMERIPYFPKMLTEMTGVGEQAGSLENTLDVIGTYYTNEVEVYTGRLLSLLEPAITIGLAVMTVILLLAVYLPMFSMYGGI